MINEHLEFNEFLKQNPTLPNSTTLGPPAKENEFLINRLNRTFQKGVEVGRRMQRELIVKQFTDWVQKL